MIILLLTPQALVAIDFEDCEGEEVWRAIIKEWSGNSFRIDLNGVPSGLGFAVGWEGAQLWIAAPAHVIYGQEEFQNEGLSAIGNPGKVRARLSVRVSSSGEELALCDDPNNPSGFNKNKDLTFVCVEKPPTHYLLRELTVGKVSKGDQYRLVGHSGQPKPDQLAGNVNHASREGEFDLELRGNSVVKPDQGLSGAMVVTPAGLAGLYIGSDNYSRGIGIATIRMEADEAEVTWSLIDRDYYDCTSEHEVCLIASNPLWPEKLIVKARGQDVTTSLNEGKTCLMLREGRFTIAPGNSRLRCEPIGFRVNAGSTPINQSITCRLNLGGAWSTDSFGRLFCSQGLFGDAHCTGLEGIGRGTFSGILSSNGARILLNGKFLSAYRWMLPGH